MSRTSRIVFITREGYRLAGARIRCYNFAAQLKKYGYETEVLSFADHLGAPDGDKELCMSLRRKLFCNIGAFKKLMREHKDSIFFLQRFNYHSLAPFFASCLKGYKMIFDCDDWNIREDPKYYAGIFPSSKMEFLTKRMASSAHACIVASGYLEDFLSPYSRRIFRVPTGVDTGLFRPDPQVLQACNAVVIGWMGTVYHEDMYRNLIFLVECFSDAARLSPNIMLKIAGEGKYFEKLKRDISGFFCKDKIKMIDWMPPAQVPVFLKNVDIGVLPLIHETKFNRAKSPVKLFEYMACSKPTLSSRIGEASNIIKDGANGFLAGSRDEFLKKLDILICDAGLRRRMGMRARSDVEENYSQDIIGKKLSEICALVGKI